MMNEPGIQESVAQFLSTGEQFITTVQNLPEGVLDCALASGEWTIRQIVHHVSDDADLWCFSLKKAIAAPGAPIRFEGFPGNERWFAALGYSTRPVQSALALMQAHHRLMAELVAASAPSDVEKGYVALFDDKGNELGSWSPAQIIQMLHNHLCEHLTTIQAIGQREIR